MFESSAHPPPCILLFSSGRGQFMDDIKVMKVICNSFKINAFTFVKKISVSDGLLFFSLRSCVVDWLTSAHKVISVSSLWRGVAVGVEGEGLIICLSPTDRFRYQKKMYIIKIEGLIITNWLARHILISVTVFEIQGFEKSQKQPPTPDFGEILPWLFCAGETLDSQLSQIC